MGSRFFGIGFRTVPEPTADVHRWLPVLGDVAEDLLENGRNGVRRDGLTLGAVRRACPNVRVLLVRGWTGVRHRALRRTWVHPRSVLDVGL